MLVFLPSLLPLLLVLVLAQVDATNPFTQSAVVDDGRHDPYGSFFAVRLVCYATALVLTITIPSLPSLLFLPQGAAYGKSSLYSACQRITRYHYKNALGAASLHLVFPQLLLYTCPQNKQIQSQERRSQQEKNATIYLT
jgi:hypothetical protein